MSKRAKRLQKISRRLTTHQLRRLEEKALPLDFGGLFSREEEDRSSPFFLGYYSPAGIKYALEKYGVFDELRKMGFDHFKLSIDTKDPYRQRLAIYYQRKDPDHLLGELVLKRKHITVYTRFPSLIHGRTYETIAVEWLCMQNPLAQFTRERPRLPGQKYPGLGMGEMVLELLVIMCGRLRTAGLLNVPEYFHNAQMYSLQFIYLDPLLEGKRRAIARDLLPKYHLATVSWAIDQKCVLENGKPFEWFVGEQIIPLDRQLKEYFRSKEYKSFLKQTMNEYSYTLDEAKWEVKSKNLNFAERC